MIHRRLFLGALAAPAIVRASSLMPIWVPKQAIAYDELSRKYVAEMRAALLDNLRLVNTAQLRYPASWYGGTTIKIRLPA